MLNFAMVTLLSAVSTFSILKLEQAGEIYFHSTHISSDNAISCASCHSPATAFQDGYERALARNRVLSRNTPTTLNVNRYALYFWDGRASNLPEQIKGPLFSRHEINSSEEILLKFTNAQPDLKQTWQNSELPILEFVQRALIVYLQTNATTTTKFDNFLAGRESLSSNEVKGWKLFSDKFQCTACHTLPNFTDNKFHDIGIFRKKIILQTNANPGQANRYELGYDYGRANISDQTTDLHAFRTPSLFNVMKTAPYMHNGLYPNMEDVLNFYSAKRVKAGQAGFSAEEMENLTAFLHTLTDSRFSEKAK